MANGAGGRPTKFKEEYIELAYNYCLLGATDSELATFFDVAESTIHKWKLDFPLFSESLKRGKSVADAKVAQALFSRATGFSCPDTDIKMFEGSIIKTEFTKHYPPDATSMIFWLKNRQPEKWREKREPEPSTTDKEITINVVRVSKKKDAD